MTFILLNVVALALSVFLFVRREIVWGIVIFLLMLLYLLILLTILRGGGIVIDFKKNRLIVNSRDNSEAYALDKVKEILISFHFDQIYMRYSANVTIYFKNSKAVTVCFKPYEWRWIKHGVPFHNKERIERQAKRCNIISCCTID